MFKFFRILSTRFFLFANSTVCSVIQNAYGSLVRAYATAQSPQSKKRRVARAQPTLATQFQASALDRVEAVTHIFAGREICVLTGLPETSKQDLECKVAENGGTVVQNPGQL